ncbi:F-box/kelch-repeat protein At3g06240-like [Rosa rugosa]|uniref:F-box/kelch-repeat protein At3g06240-like n=1 Tax=Rosa rugosa TaxID=74645 RepID=UPI002B416003|nr:F-box/kelch-repeat protein At3g06240-like [Rosa rugosa]
MEDRGQNVDLPPEIIYEILSRLPVKPLYRFKCVSKPWRPLISHPDFVANYSKAIENKDVFFRRRRLLFTLYDPPKRLYSLNLDQFLNENHNVDVDSLVATPTELDFVYNHIPTGQLGWIPFVHCSCYGLFLSLVASEGCYSVSLINPVTKESKTLEKAPIERSERVTRYPRHLYGLGFDYSTNEYKVIHVRDYHHGTGFCVYTLQTDSWRQIDPLFPYNLLPYDGILVNGGVHWLVTKVADNSLVIMSFLLAEEEVREIALPPNATSSIRLVAFRNWLCITPESPKNDEVTFNEFWIMKEYGVRESWTKMQVSIPFHRLSHSGFWTETYDLMVFDDSLVMYNFDDGTFWNLSIGNTSENHFGTVGIYLESLPSLNRSRTTRPKEDESTQ